MVTKSSGLHTVWALVSIVLSLNSQFDHKVPLQSTEQWNIYGLNEFFSSTTLIIKSNLVSTVMKCSILHALMATNLMAASFVLNRYNWTPTLADYFDVVFQYMQQAKAPEQFSRTCDLSRAVMPIAPTPLPLPSGLVLEHVAVGRGVQVRHWSYTCKLLYTNTRRTTHVPVAQPSL